jgi:hypothetical protein
MHRMHRLCVEKTSEVSQGRLLKDTVLSVSVTRGERSVEWMEDWMDMTHANGQWVEAQTKQEQMELREEHDTKNVPVCQRNRL